MNWNLRWLAAGAFAAAALCPTYGAMASGSAAADARPSHVVRRTRAESPPAPARKVPNFAGIAWGLTPDQVKAALKEKGYDFTKVDNDGDLWFKGRLGAHDAIAGALMSPTAGLVKVFVGLLTDDSDALDVYHKTFDALTARYGKPDHSYEFYDDPHEKGDGREETAIKVGKGHIAAFWDFETKDAGLELSVSRGLAVTIAYQAPGWKKEYDRRHAKALGAARRQHRTG
ncbi:MAG TPA: hypothetical protein VFJ58_09645 [Armatimonadota bacterium]|nr:hypothetical protein [Armatimonadota bacterium]